MLLTGASGFIGRAVARRLMARGLRLKVVSRSPAKIAGLFDCVVPLPEGGDLETWRQLLEGVTHVVHCAGIADTDAKTPHALYSKVNASLTVELASAAASCIAGKFVFLSSIRAAMDQTRPRFSARDFYGESKMEGERGVRAAFGENGRFTILRPVMVYGVGVRGNFGSLLRLARMPLPLPLAGLSARRSLLELNACAEAVEHALFSQATNGGIYALSDSGPLTLAEIVAALRRGAGQKPNLFFMPPALLSIPFHLLGKQEAWRRLTCTVVADPSDFAATGWQPVEDSSGKLEALARSLE